MLGVTLTVENAEASSTEVVIKLAASGTPSAPITLKMVQEHLLARDDGGPAGLTTDGIVVGNWDEIGPALELR